MHIFVVKRVWLLLFTYFFLKSKIFPFFFNENLFKNNFFIIIIDFY